MQYPFVWDGTQQNQAQEVQPDDPTKMDVERTQDFSQDLADIAVDLVSQLHPSDAQLQLINGLFSTLPQSETQAQLQSTAAKREKYYVHLNCGTRFHLPRIKAMILLRTKQNIFLGNLENPLSEPKCPVCNVKFENAELENIFGKEILKEKEEAMRRREQSDPPLIKH